MVLELGEEGLRRPLPLQEGNLCSEISGNERKSPSGESRWLAFNIDLRIYKIDQVWYVRKYKQKIACDFKNAFFSSLLTFEIIKNSLQG